MQNWNTLLKYIKRKVGAPLVHLEYSDNDIYEIVRDDVIPVISQFVGKPIWLEVSITDKLATTRDDNNIIMPNTFQIPIPDNVILTEVHEVYYSDRQWGIMGSFRELIGVIDPRNIAISNTFVDMIESLDTVQAFRFIRPDKLVFEERIKGERFVCECRAVHKDLSTIPSDVFEEFVKPMSRKEVLEDLVAIRSKYEQLNTPLGEIRVNWNKLEQDASRLEQEINEKLDSMPPDHLIHII